MFEKAMDAMRTTICRLKMCVPAREKKKKMTQAIRSNSGNKICKNGRLEPKETCVGYGLGLVAHLVSAARVDKKKQRD